MPSIIRRPASSLVDEFEILFDWKHSIFQFLSSACSHRTWLLAFARISRKSAITMKQVRMWEVGKRPWSVYSFIQERSSPFWHPSNRSMPWSDLFCLIFSIRIRWRHRLVWYSCLPVLFTCSPCRSSGQWTRFSHEKDLRLTPFDSYILFNDRDSNEEIEETPFELNNNASQRVSFRYLTREDDRHYLLHTDRWSIRPFLSFLFSRCVRTEWK